MDKSLSTLPELVIERILWYLKVSEVGIIRLLCASWNSAGTRVLNQRMDEMRLRMEPSKPEYSGILCLLVEDTTKSSGLDWSNFYFCHLNMKCVEFTRLLGRTGLDITILKLNYNEEDAKAKRISSYTLGTLLATQVPFLEELELEALPMTIKTRALFPIRTNLSLPELELRRITFAVTGFRQDEDIYSAAFLKSLFRSCPKLTELVIRDEHSYASYDDQLSILTAFSTDARSQLTLLKLGTETNQVLNVLASAVDLSQLKTFKLTNVPDDYDPSLIQKMLISMKDTLESLRISVGYYRLLPFPVMPTLKKLHIRALCSSGFMEFEDGGMPPKCPFNWGIQFPKLTTLHLEDVGTKYADGFLQEDVFPIDATPCPTVRTLEIPPELEPEVFTRLQDIFPNVVKLIVPVQTNEEIFSLLWTSWPNLEALVLSAHYFDVSSGMYECSDRESDTSESDCWQSISSDDDEEMCDVDVIDDEGDCSYTVASVDEVDKEVANTDPGNVDVALKTIPVSSDDDSESENDYDGGASYRRERREERRNRRNFDSLLTGISKADLVAMKKSIAAGKRFTETEIEAKRSFPSLMNLKRLQHLVIYDGWLSKFACRRARISDLSVTLCLSRMKELKTIFIADGAFKITEGGADDLCADLKLQRNYETSDYGLHLVKYNWQVKRLQPYEIKKSILK